MINSVSIEEAIELLQPCEVEGSFVEKYIPSKDVRAKMESDNWTFSDRDKAAIIWNPEISVPAEHVNGIVFEIFKRYLDMELIYNKRRVRFDYDPNGKKVIGFGIDMIHNFYDAEHIEKLSYNLIAVSLYLCDRSYVPENADISAAVVKEIDKFDSKIAELNEKDRFERKWEYAEFLRDLADRVMGLINYGKDKDAIISIMAP